MHSGILVVISPLFAMAIATACGGETFTTDGDNGVTGGSTNDAGAAAGQSGSGGDNTGGNGGSVSTGGMTGGGMGGATGECGDLVCEPGELCESCAECCEPGGTGGMMTGGAGGMATGGGGAMATGGSGGGGCTDPDGADASVKSTATGLNGTFADECDVSGNLVEYVCERIIDPSCLPNPDPSCFMMTGDVLPSSLYCAGACMEGTCAARCPQQNDRVTYLELQADGTAVFRNENDGRTYVCEIYFNDPMDPYECGAVGDIVRVASLGLETTSCVPGPIGYIGLGQVTGPYQCTYYCGVAN